jgi:hypothetical protein
MKTVRGIVVPAVFDGDAPIAGATVEVRKSSSASHKEALFSSHPETRPIAVTTTAQDGTFKFERLAPGNYVITVAAPNYVRASGFLTVVSRSDGGTTSQDAVAVLSLGTGRCSYIEEEDRERNKARQLRRMIKRHLKQDPWIWPPESK